MHAGVIMSASEDEIAEVLGERADESIIERIANTGASIEDVHEAFEDLEFEMRFGEERVTTSPMVEEVRRILEELPYFEEVEKASVAEDEEEEDVEGFTVLEENDEDERHAEP
jgi:hypothetical protein